MAGICGGVWVSVTLDALAIEIAQRQLASQKEDLRNLRNQASFSAAVTGIIATFFATLVPETKLVCSPNCICAFGIRIEVWMVLALVFAAMLCSVLVISGWRKVTFEVEITEILKRKASQTSIGEVQAWLAQDLNTFFDQNESVLENAKARLTMGLILALAQFPAWLLLI